MATATGQTLRDAYANTTPQELAVWRLHFRRFPPDGVERLQYNLLALQCADPKPLEEEARPWAFPPGAAEEARKRADEKAKDVQIALPGGGGFVR